MDKQPVITLLQKHFSATASETETAALMEWLAQVDAREFDEVIESFPNDFAKLKAMSGTFGEKMERRIDQEEVVDEKQEVVMPVHRVHFLRTAWFRYAAAILIILGVGSYLYITNQKEKPSVTQTNPVPVQNDALPGREKATLTLADGKTINLDEVKSGEIAAQTGAVVVKNEEGKIEYKQRGESDVSIAYNTMTTPRGGQYQLTLPDGSQVWLNAESSITYPTAFNTDERRVSITGEAYFEVTHNARQPFRVESDGQLVEVLGTKFNINAYREEPTINTTLLEGAIRLSANARTSNPPGKSVHTSLILKPGQQGQLANDKLSLAVKPDVDKALAWKNGKFDFNNVAFADAMRQLERWYDVEVVYAEGKIPQMKFIGKMGRDLKLSQVLTGLQALGIQYTIEGKRLTVKSVSVD